MLREGISVNNFIYIIYGLSTDVTNDTYPVLVFISSGLYQHLFNPSPVSRHLGHSQHYFCKLCCAEYNSLHIFDHLEKLLEAGIKVGNM